MEPLTISAEIVILFLTILLIIGRRFKNTASFLFVGGVVLAAALVAVSDIRDYRKQQAMKHEEVRAEPRETAAQPPRPILRALPPVQFNAGARGAAAPAAVVNPFAPPAKKS